MLAKFIVIPNLFWNYVDLNIVRNTEYEPGTFGNYPVTFIILPDPDVALSYH